MTATDPHAQAHPALDATAALQIVEQLQHVIYRTDRDGRIVYCNHAWSALTGFAPEETLGRPALSFVVPDDQAQLAAKRDVMLRGAVASTRHRTRLLHRDGHEVWIEASIQLLRDDAGNLVGTFGTLIDLTEQQHLIENLHQRDEQERRFQQALLALHEIRNVLSRAEDLDALCRHAVAQGITRLRFDRLSIWLTAGAGEIRGTYGTDETGQVRDERATRLAVSVNSAMGRVLYAREHLVSEEDGAIFNHIGQTLGAGAHIIAAIWDGEEMLGALSMDTFLSRQPVTEYDGELLELYAATIGHHIVQWRTQEALRRGEAEYRRLFNTMTEGVAVHEMLYDEAGGPTDYRFLEINPAFEALTGLQKEHVIGRTVRTVMPDIEQAWIDRYSEVVRTGQSVTFMMFSAPLGRHYEVVAFSPAPGQFATLFLDVSERIYAEENRLQLEEQLRQAQKMEAVGRLAGGIAHDFNNLLSPILGYADLVLLDPTLPPATQEQVTRIRDAAQRAASLTRQMLAFSRKQVLEMRPLALAAVVDDFAPMLQKLIGEDILLAVTCAPDAWYVDGDATQVQQILMNLVINGRDAMPQGGTLLLDVQHVTATAELCRTLPSLTEGDYVQLSVTDTGVGMDPATRERIFEPFFTTKEVGRGTGLGMSTVYGIVQQHRGAITVESHPGAGTTVRVLLPRGADAPAAEHARPHAALPSAPAQTTLLLVEDDAMVRALAQEQLAGAGYRVLTAANGAEALALCRQTAATITLLVTDVIMPGLNGKELFEQLSITRPALRVVYISGYSDDILGHQGVLTPGTHFIAKPFTLHSFLRVVEGALR